MEKNKAYSMKRICTELGNEIYLVPNEDEMIRFYEKEGNNLDIYPAISIIEAFYRFSQNTNVSVFDVLRVVYNNNNNNNNNASMNEREIYGLVNAVFLPKISNERALPIV